MQSLLIIGYVWPEPTATAAGSRMLQLIRQFQQLHYQIAFACPAVKPTSAFKLSTLGIVEKEIKLNHVSFDEFLKELNPKVVLFDRFLMEEQFGWRVEEICPQAIRFLDSEDLHFLRKARAEAVKKGKDLPKDLIFSDDAKREIASMYRCDVTLTISEFEMDYLQKVYQIPTQLLWYVPFLLDVDVVALPKYKERQDFVFIGNFIHAPNWDAVLQLKQEIWPLIREKLPQAKLHIYGAYPSEKVYQLHNPKQGFWIQGRAACVKEVMQKAKVCLAPLRFGAGLKGKLIDAMQNETPFVTSSIGAEGMFGPFDFSEEIADTPADFAKKAIDLYTDALLWETHQKKGKEVLKTRFAKEIFEEEFAKKVTLLETNLEAHRAGNFVGAMLQYHTLKSSKYLSKWIEAKNQI